MRFMRYSAGKNRSTVKFGNQVDKKSESFNIYKDIGNLRAVLKSDIKP